MTIPNGAAAIEAGPGPQVFESVGSASGLTKDRPALAKLSRHLSAVPGLVHSYQSGPQELCIFGREKKRLSKKRGWRRSLPFSHVVQLTIKQRETKNMKKFIRTLFMLGLLAAFAGGVVTHTQADAPSRPLPFNGKVKEINKEAKTFTLQGGTERTFHIVNETKVTKAGKEAKLEDAVVGEVVGGSYRKLPDGKLQAVSVRFGAKVEEASKSKRKKEAPSVD
jgi:hypothetical protein